MNHSENDQSNLQKIIDEIQKKILITTDVKKCVSEIINDLFKNRETNRLSNDPINFCHNQTKRSIDFNTNQIDENQFNNFPYSGSSTDYDPCLSDRLTDNPSYLQDSMISSDSPLSDDTMMPEKIVELLVQSFLDTEFYVHKLAVIYIIFSNVKVHKKGFWHTENIKDIFLTLLKDNIQLLARTVIEQACDFFIKNWDEILHFSRTFNKCDSEDHDSIEKQPLMIICQKLLDDDLFEYITFLKGKNDYLQAGVGDLFCLLHKYLEYGQYLPNFKFNKIKEKILDLLKRFIKWPYIRVKHAIILRMKDMPLFYNTIMEVLIHETNSLLIINLIKNLNDYHLLHFLKECKVVRLEIIDEINKRIEGGFSFLLKEKMIREKTFEYKKIENKLFDINSLQEKEDDDEFRRNLGMKSPTELKTNLFDILESDPSIEVKFKVLNMLKNPNLICLFCGDKNWRKRKRALEILLEFLQKTSILDKKEKKKN
ncbi:Protein phosphatase 2A regulatory subunit A, partial [Pseudoloma neurophilia]